MRTKIDGSFNWETLLCRFFLNDLDPFAPISPAQPLEPMALLAAQRAKQGSDGSLMRVLPERELLEVQQTLFHEEVHYWQLLSSPFLQSLFLSALQKTRLVVAANGGNPHAVCGEPGFDGAVGAVTRSLRACYAAMSRTMGEPEGILDSQLVIDPPTFVRRFGWTYPPDDDPMPGYLIVLLYPESVEACSATLQPRVVNIDLTTLTESHAFISESQFKGCLPSRLAWSDPTDHELYKGIWEAWSRYYPGQPADVRARALAIVLQTAFDGGLPHALMQFQELEDFPVERFKRLLIRSPQAINSALATASEVQSYRAELEILCKLTPQAKVLSAAKARLMRVLIFSLAPFLGHAYPWASWVEELLDSERIDWKALEAVKQVFSKAQQLPLGAQVIATMYNAIELRQSDPTLFALPALNRDRLEKAFPLPLILLRGQYCFAGTGLVPGQPIPVWLGMLRHEVVALASVRPMIQGSYQCGFLESGAQCWYVAEGLGCPRSAGEISPEVFDVRVRTQLLNWCHRLHVDLRLGLATPEDLNFWTNREPPATPFG